uniref:Uncharacterized protein n=1 Tax=Panagrolaimus davidi TaxID=227884 RepID=A0A914RCS6_9BILA
MSSVKRDQIVASNSSKSIIKMTKNNVSMIFPNCAQFYSSCQLQNFSLSDCIIFYVSKNPSTPEFYQKLIQSCKHFFIKNPIIVIDFLDFVCINGYKTMANGNCIELSNIYSKLWITKLLNVQTPENIFLSNISKFYSKCDIRYLYLYDQTLNFYGLKMIAKKCEKVVFDNVAVINNGNSVVTLEKIVGVLPNIQKFKYDFRGNANFIMKFETVAELIQLQNFLNVTRFELRNIPVTFDVSTFYNHIKKNQTAEYHLHFGYVISVDEIPEDEIEGGIPDIEINVEYKTRLQKIVDEILETENRDYKVPIIEFDGQDGTAYINLVNLFQQK